MIALGSDHVGIELKRVIIQYFNEKNIEFKDIGAFSEERTDYPIFAEKVAKSVVNGECEKGIIFCGTGIGISIAANKVNGIRAVVCSDCYSAKLSKEHNNTNILALGSRVVGIELAKLIVDTWLETEFEGGRHQRRIEQISKIESNEKLL